MKEFTIEEKAKAYDEAIDKVAHFIKKHIGLGCIIHPNSSEAKELFNIFPELKESEDDRIRKALIDYFNDANKADENPLQSYGIHTDKAIAWLEKQGDTNETINKNNFAQNVLKGAAINLITWIDYNSLEDNMCLSNKECKDIEDALVSGDWNKIYAYMKKKLEKQGEQKPILDFKAKDYYVSKVDGKIHNIYGSVDNVKPKFKVGDWVVRGDTIAQILNIQEQYYVGLDIEGNDFTSSKFLADNKIHLWNINDAKDGDVLASQYNKPFIYNGNCGSCSIGAYCGISIDDKFKIATGKYTWAENVNIHPATKEQQAILMKAIDDANYKWDAEKKELKPTK